MRGNKTGSITGASLFDAHNHLQLYAGPAELGKALKEAAAAGVKLMACNGSFPGDWTAVAALCAGRPGIVPFFGVHPWHIGKAGPDWLQALERMLASIPSGVGETGLDRAKGADPSGQEEIFREHLRLAVKLERPLNIHCVRAWGRLLDILKEEKPPVFLVHAYGGPAELVPELAKLGAYFSFGGDLADEERARLRKALAAVPACRLLFETDSPGPRDVPWEAGPAGLAAVIKLAAAALGRPAEDLAAASFENGKSYLGGLVKGKI